MSPSSKSRSKDKKNGKEAAKTSSSKSSTHVNAGAGVPANGYNPVLGTFHTVDTTASFSSPRVHVNGRYQTIEETDDHSSNSIGTGVECDSISNNGSWSGESEDHKEKASNQPLRQEAVPGADNDKREKIRQKNEKKHQRQKERRAQELHERCSSYLMSRKLKALSQQLVSMGFSQERVTMALIYNEGRVEESVAWLLEGGEEADNNTKEQNLDGGGSLKIDISEEIARIAEMEIRCKCSRQEVERAIVACEGDLELAEKSLRMLKEEPPSIPPKPERTDDPPVPGNGKVQVVSSQNLMRAQQKTAPTATIQQQRNEREFNYTKLGVAVGSSVDPGNRNLQSSERIQPKMDWGSKPQHNSVPTEKRWPVAATSPISLSPALQAPPPPTKSESCYVPVGSEVKNQLPGSQREPIMVQGPQSITGKMASSTSVGSSSTAMGWSLGNNVEILKSNGFIPTVSETRTINSAPGTLGTNQLYNQFAYHPSQAFVSSGTTVESLGTNRGNGLLSRTSVSPTIAAASSLGLYSGFGANVPPSGSSSFLDWNSGSSVAQSDYTSIDWSLERGSSSMSRSSGMWPGMNGYDSRTYDAFMSSRMGVNPNQNPHPHPPPSMRRVMSRGNSFPLGLQDGVVGSTELSSSNSREWTSPFEERDIFSLPRNYVSSSPSVEHLGEYLKRMNK